MKFILTILFSILLVFSNIELSGNQIDSLNNVLLTTSKKEEKTKILITLSQLYAQSSKMDSFQIYVNKAYTSAKNLENEELIAKTLINLGIYNLYIDEIEVAKKHFEKSYKIAKANELDLQMGKAAGNTAVANGILGNYREAIKWQLIEIEKLEKAGNRLNIHNSLINLAINQGKIQDYNAYYETSKKLLSNAEVSQDSTLIIESSLNYVRALTYQDSSKKALRIINNLLKSRLIEKNTSLRYNLYNELFIILSTINDFDEILKYESNFDSIQNLTFGEYGLIGILGSFSLANIEKGNFDKSIDYNRRLLDYAIKFQNYADLNQTYELFHLAYKEKGEIDSAYKYLQLYKKSSDSLLNSEKIKAIKDIQAKYELDKKDNQILSLEKLKGAQQKTIFWQWLGFALLVSLLIILIQRYYSNKRKATEKAENQKKLYQKELELKESESKRLIQVKENELKLRVTQLSENRLVIENLREEIDKIEQSVSESKSLNDILNDLSLENNPELSLKEFEFKFTEIYPDFYKKLKSDFPDISTTELRMSSFLKMNMSTKEIAAIMNLSPLTIKKHRSNIRKKLNIDAENSIQDFLNKI